MISPSRIEPHEEALSEIEHTHASRLKGQPLVTSENGRQAIGLRRSLVDFKRLATMMLSPFTLLSVRLRGTFGRAWAHALLARQTKSSVPLSLVILGAAEIQGTGRVRFGENLLLYRELYFETQEAGSITIGDDVVISRGVHIVSFDRIEIGTGTMIGEYSSIRDANHRIGGPDLVRYSGHDAAPINIGRNVWIGRGVAVLPGVTIGDNSVIGANAVVTHDIPDYTVAVGVPARAISKTTNALAG
jgi:acetyltransferase-like isoleucine patch superfamily enzyme